MALEDLPDLLIQARIANRWSQKQVAERLGIHEQQVQRYEATRYRGVSFDRLLEIAKILGIHVEQKVVLAAPLLKNARAHLLELGFSAEFIDARVLSNHLEREPDRKVAAAVSALERLRHIFGWTLEELAGPQPPRVSAAAAGGALFKLPAGRKTPYLEAYTAYGFRLALKSATQRVARRRGVAVGALANHLAWVLARQDRPINWWGTAHNLQEDAKADLAYARDVAFERLTPPIGDDLDVELLFRALRAQEPA